MKQDQLTAIVFCDGEAPRRIVVTGVRVCQALRVLRHDHGLRIDIKREPNSDGIGKHGRYFLRDCVQIIDPEREAA